MIATAARRRRVAAPVPFTFLAWRERWVLVNGEWLREAAVRRADGALRVYLLRETDPLAVAA